MNSSLHLLRLALISVAVGGFLSAGGLLRADPAPASNPTPFTREQAIGALTRAIAGHYNLEGDLQLEFIRPWTPPSRVATVWELNVLEFPAVPTSSLMIRCRIVADATRDGNFPPLMLEPIDFGALYLQQAEAAAAEAMPLTAEGNA